MKPSLNNRDFKHIIRTKSQPQFRLLSKPIMLAGTLVLFACAVYLKVDSSAPVSTENTVKTVSVQIPPATNTPAQQQHDVITPAAQPIKQSWQEYKVKRGDNLAKIFDAQNLSATTLHYLIQSSTTAAQLKHVKPGQIIRFFTTDDGDFNKLEYEMDRVKTLVVAKTEDGFSSSINESPVEISHSSATVEINNSLFYDGKQAGLSDKTIMELANIFGWDIDFSQGLRAGDQFTMLYETQSIDGEPIENGNILAAEFINRGETIRAVRYVYDNGDAEYFSPNGKSMRKTFLRNPIDFARVSSHFNLKRKHPILNRIRAHKGVDYAAVTGTPIKSVGDGKVIFRGVKGGYGRVMIVQHGQKYSSLYAHLSKYGRYKNGSSVKQGQIIGYVGSSGLATGPHLHYELRVNGVHRNPLTVKFPAAKPINKNLLAQFKAQTAPLLAQLDSAKQTQLALY